MSTVSTERVRRFICDLRNSPDPKDDRKIIKAFEAELDAIEAKGGVAVGPSVPLVLVGQTTIDDYLDTSSVS